MRIALLEDDKQETKDFLDAFAGWDPSRRIECFTDTGALLEAAKQNPPFSVAFLDIYLPKESGLEAAEKLRRISPETELVFETTSHEHAISAFNLEALHYLVKPITTQAIREVFERIRKKQAARPALSLKSGRDTQMIYLDTIAYISSDNHRILIHLNNEAVLEAYMRLSDIGEQLDTNFLKVQRGLIVNAAYIERMRSDSCTLKNGLEILLSRKERQDINQAYKDYIFRHLSARTSKTL